MEITGQKDYIDDYVPRLGGGKVLLTSLDPPELLRAYMEAIGPPPMQPNAEGQGYIEVTAASISDRGVVTGYTATYNPAGHELNQDRMAKWKNEFDAWKAQCEPILAV